MHVCSGSQRTSVHGVLLCAHQEVSLHWGTVLLMKKLNVGGQREAEQPSTHPVECLLSDDFLRVWWIFLRHTCHITGERQCVPTQVDCTTKWSQQETIMISEISHSPKDNIICSPYYKANFMQNTSVVLSLLFLLHLRESDILVFAFTH